ncbi:hypothetical protein ACFFOU_00055 [Pseudonocardia sulfidoxydans]|nr:hypothetical protein [Pseudonocardia sulfidoxydans]
MVLHDVLTWSALAAAVLLFAVMTAVPLLLDHSGRPPGPLPSRR